MLWRGSICVLVAAGLALGAGCDGPLDIDLEDAVGTFVLKRVAGKKLPDPKDRDDRDDPDDLDGAGDAAGLPGLDDRRDGRDRLDRRDRDDDKGRPRLLEKTAEFEILVVHETIRLRADGTGTITSVVDLFLIETGKFDKRRTITRDVRFTLDDDQILIADLCDPEVDCVLPRSLVMWPSPSWSPRVLYQAFSPFGGPALLYRRVSTRADVDVDEDEDVD